MGRSPCCDKLGLKKGPWTPEEDQKLLAYIEEHGHGNWRALPSKAGLQRCGKSCRLRWTNYLRPDIKRGKFSLQEEQTIIQLHALLGNRWSAIATHLPKRTDNEIKNYWNTHLKKRLTKMGIDPVTHKPKNEGLLSTCDGGQQSKNAATLSHMAQWESARLEAEARLVRQSKLRSSPSSPSLITPHNPPHPIINSFGTNVNNNNNNNNNTSRDDSSSNGTNIMPRCLDVLKVWNHSNSGTTPGIGLGLIGGGGGSLGLGLDSSPTSTLSFSENGPLLLQGPTTVGPAVIEFMEHGNDNRSNNNRQVEQELGKEKDKRRADYDNNGGHSRYHGVNMTMMENSLSFSASSELNDVMESNDNNDKRNYDDEVDDDDDDDQDHHQSFMEGFTQLLLGGATVLNNSNSNIDNNEKSQIEEVDVEDEGGSHRSSNNNNNNKSNNGRGCTSSSSCSDYYEDNKNYWNTILNLVNSSPSHSPMF